MAPSRFDTAAGVVLATVGDGCEGLSDDESEPLTLSFGVGECGCVGTKGCCIDCCGECVVDSGAELFTATGGSIRLAIDGEAEARFT